jgi:hypothetical protein
MSVIGGRVNRRKQTAENDNVVTKNLLIANRDYNATPTSDLGQQMGTHQLS